uniref:Uncharacterized protein n=2 Tax=Candidatus Kentrum sp. FW TaxID=2126338 RepID=A0A450U2J3_9GAMM|nr:MAG: hypothetical protein BECKFW1821C_GA0114237_111910 [Candidatus Kentron sp. FW]
MSSASMLYETDFHAWANREAALSRAGNFLARLCLGPLIHHLFLPSLALGPGIPCRDDVGGRYNPYVIPAGNAGT